MILQINVVTAIQTLLLICTTSRSILNETKTFDFDSKLEDIKKDLQSTNQFNFHIPE